MVGDLVLLAPLAGWAMPIGETPDPVFAQKMLGDRASPSTRSSASCARHCDGEIIGLHACSRTVTIPAPPAALRGAAACGPGDGELRRRGLRAAGQDRRSRESRRPVGALRPGAAGAPGGQPGPSHDTVVVGGDVEIDSAVTRPRGGAGRTDHDLAAPAAPWPRRAQAPRRGRRGRTARRRVRVGLHRASARPELCGAGGQVLGGQGFCGRDRHRDRRQARQRQEPGCGDGARRPRRRRDLRSSSRR